MFKKVAMIVFLVLLVSSVFSIRLVDPISKTLYGDGYLGSVVPGSELELIFSKEFGRFSEFEVTTPLPSEFDVRVEDYLESIKVFINVPKNVVLTDYYFEIEMTGREIESARVYFIVKEDLLKSSLNNYYSESFVGSLANYEFSLINNSHADATYSIKPKLPFNWLEKSEYIVEVPKNSIVKKTISINPRVSGEKTFRVLVEHTNGEKEFSLFVNTKPTITGKARAVLNGFPFYSISLASGYFFNSTLAFFFN